MTAELCVAVPVMNRERYLEECLRPIRELGSRVEIVVIDDRSTDGTRKVAERYADQVIDGPGLCNWRPGAIHWPVFQAWLTTKCPYVTYMFSDDRTTAMRYEEQLRRIKMEGAAAVFSPTRLIDKDGRPGRMIFPSPTPSFGGIHTFAETLVIDREKFFAVGGLDFPVHVAAKAEAWIWAAAGAAGKLRYVGVTGFEFREHPETLSASASARYEKAVATTRFTEADQWKLWGRVEPRFGELCQKAARIHAS